MTRPVRSGSRNLLSDTHLDEHWPFGGKGQLQYTLQRLGLVNLKAIDALTIGAA